MGEKRNFTCRKQKGKQGEDVTYLSPDQMSYYNPAMLALYAYGESVLYPDHLFSGHKRPYRTMVYFALEYVCEGDYVISREGVRHHLYKGDVLILYPGFRYRRENPGKTQVKKKEVMLNNSPLISILCNRSDLNGRDVIHCSDPAAAEAYFDRIREMVARPDPEGKLEKVLPVMIFSLFNELIFQCGEKSVYSSFDNQFLQLNVFSPDLTLERMAKHFKVGKRTLNRIFHKQLNCSPFRYLVTARMNYAVQLLRSNTLSIREVAEECGYKSASFFIAEFKKSFGKTPLKYREELRIFDDQNFKIRFQKEKNSPVPRAEKHSGAPDKK